MIISNKHQEMELIPEAVASSAEGNHRRSAIWTDVLDVCEYVALSLLWNPVGYPFLQGNPNIIMENSHSDQFNVVSQQQNAEGKLFYN